MAKVNYPWNFIFDKRGPLFPLDSALSFHTRVPWLISRPNIYFFIFYLIFMDLIHFKSIIIQINLKNLIKWYLVVWIAFMKHLLAAKFVQAIFVHKIMVVGPRKECSSMVVKQNPKHNGTSLRLLMWLNSHWYIHMQASHIAFRT